MSATFTKAMPELGKEGIDSFASGVSPVAPPLVDSPSCGREALQALLAFSCLHEQLRQGREAQAGDATLPQDDPEAEEFVLDEVLQVVAERALAITGADGIAIALADKDHIVCRGVAGTIAPDRGACLDLNSSFSGACFRNAQIVRCDDSETDPRVDVHACRRLGARAMVAVPLSGRHNVVGLLEAFCTEAFGFNDSDVHSLKLLGELIVAAIKPEEEKKLEQISQRVSATVATPPTVPATIPEEEEREAPSAPPIMTQPPVEEVLDAEPVPVRVARESSRPGLVVVLVVVVVAALIGGGLWRKIHQRVPQLASTVQTLSTLTPQQGETPAAPTLRIDDIDMSTASAVEAKLAVLPKVTGIRHWSATDSSTVVIDLQDQIQYEAHRLASPDRIYFDLHDTALVPALVGRTIEIGDALLARVRVAQPMPGVTRVVLETAGASNFSISLEPNPYRLVAELRAIGAKPQSKAQFDLFRTPGDAEKNPSATGVRAAGAEDAQLRAHVPKFRIVVDAGHGGWDLGTVGRKGLLEKDLVLDIAQRLGGLLTNRLSAEVVYTRQDDSYLPLEDRAGIANQSQADLFVSVHANYSDSESARGVETYYTNTFSSMNARSHSPNAGSLQDVNWANVDIREKVQESRRFAASVQHSLYGMLAQKNPAIRDRGVKEASYVVLTGTSMPAILAEVSFVSSPTDENKLTSAAYRQEIASALYKGIANYVATSHRVKIASTSGKPTGR